MDQFWTTLTTVIVGILGLAMLAVVLSPKSTTSTVLSTGASGGATLIEAATAPVTGSTPNLGFGSLGSGLIH